MYRFHRSLKIMIIDNILVDWQSSKKVISFPTLVISFVRSYQFSDTCHSNNSSHISDQCGQKKFIYFCWPIIFYSWYIFWYHMGLGTSKNIIIYLWFTLNVMYPNEACYTYQFCEIFSIPVGLDRPKKCTLVCLKIDNMCLYVSSYIQNP